jgi:23S rRNA (uracil1939-C5)-methyltransferase
VFRYASGEALRKATLARDVKKILQRGYRWESVTPFDLFPQTGHVESVSVLVRE